MPLAPRDSSRLVVAESASQNELLDGVAPLVRCVA
jgi:hypothetical protein